MSFFAEWADLPQDDYLRLVYHVIPDGDPHQAAEHLCTESSTAMWSRPGMAEDLRDRHGAKVISLDPLDGEPGAYRVEIAHPHRNFGPRLPNLLVAAAGEGAFYAPAIRTIKLIDIAFPDVYLRRFDGPQFGVGGLRERFAIHDRPFFFGVVKPNLGLRAEDFAALTEAAWVGGLDFCKDDEMQADAEWAGLRERVIAVTAARRRAEARTGEAKGFIANVTDEVAAMPALVTAAESAGASAVMCNPLWSGISAVRTIRAVARVPVMGHFAGVAVVSRQPMFGVASPLLAKLFRLAGCDIVGIAGFGPRMRSTPDEVRANITACLAPMGPIKPALPVPGGSDSAATLARVAQQVGHVDFGFIAGRGVFAHPDGPAAGARAIRDAWELFRSA